MKKATITVIGWSNSDCNVQFLENSERIHSQRNHECPL